MKLANGQCHTARSFLKLSAGLMVSSASFGQSGPTPNASDAAHDAPLVLPKMTITSERLNPRWLIPQADVKEPDFTGVEPYVIFPSRARFESVFDGRATVGVMLDAEGNATDFLLVRYTKQYFGDELMIAVRNETFTPRRIKGVAVPGRFYFGQRFYAGGAVPMTPMDAMTELTNRITHSLRGGPPDILEPQLEHAIDGRTLQFTATVVPSIPNDHEAPSAQGVKVVVSFYVDGEGNARLPNVESVASPMLVSAVIQAVAQWRFVPPTIKGKPALVFAVRSVLLEPSMPRSGAAAAAP